MEEHQRLIVATTWRFDSDVAQEIRARFQRIPGLDNAFCRYEPKDDVFIVDTNNILQSAEVLCDLVTTVLDNEKEDDLLETPRITPIVAGTTAEHETMAPEDTEIDGALIDTFCATEQTSVPLTIKYWQAKAAGIDCLLRAPYDVLREVSKLTGADLFVDDVHKRVRVTSLLPDEVEEALSKLATLETWLALMVTPHVTNALNVGNAKDFRLRFSLYGALNEIALRRVLVDVEPKAAAQLPGMFVTVLEFVNEETHTSEMPKHIKNPPRFTNLRKGRSMLWSDFKFKELGDGSYLQELPALQKPAADTPGGDIPPNNSVPQLIDTLVDETAFSKHRFLTEEKMTLVDKWVAEGVQAGAVGTSGVEPNSMLPPEPSQESSDLPKAIPGVKKRVALTAAAQPAINAAAARRVATVEGTAAGQQSEAATKAKAKVHNTTEVRGITPLQDEPFDLTARRSATSASVGRKKISPTTTRKRNTASQSKPGKSPDLVDLSSPGKTVASAKVPGRVLFTQEPLKPSTPDRAPVAPAAKDTGKSAAGNKSLSHLLDEDIPSLKSPIASTIYEAVLKDIGLDVPNLLQEAQDRVPPQLESGNRSRNLSSPKVKQESPPQKFEQHIQLRKAELQAAGKVPVKAGFQENSSRQTNNAGMVEGINETGGEEFLIKERKQLRSEAESRVFHRIMRQRAAKSQPAPSRAEQKAKRAALIAEAWGVARPVAPLSAPASKIGRSSNEPSTWKMEQLAGAVEDKVKVIKDLYHCLEPVLEAARCFTGSLSLELQMGLVLIYSVPKQYTNSAFEPKTWNSVFRPSHNLRPPSTKFTNMLTTSGADVDYIVNLTERKDGVKHRLFSEEIFSRRVVYEFHCQTNTNEGLVITVRESGATFVNQPEILLGAVNVHCPGRTWDMSAVVRGSSEYSPGVNADIDNAVQYVIDNIHVPPNRSRVMLFTRVPTGNELRVTQVLMKRSTRHRYLGEQTRDPTGQCINNDVTNDAKLPTNAIALDGKSVGGNGDIAASNGKSQDPSIEGGLFLQVTEVQNLCFGFSTLDKSILRARSASSDEMVDWSRFWYEVSVISPAIEDMLQGNKSLDIGERTDEWCAADILGAEPELPAAAAPVPSQTAENLTSEGPDQKDPDSGISTKSSACDRIKSAGLGGMFRVAQRITELIDGIGWANVGPAAEFQEYPSVNNNSSIIAPSGTRLQPTLFGRSTAPDTSAMYSTEEFW